MTITYTWTINSLEVEKERIFYTLSGSEDPDLLPHEMTQVQDGEPLQKVILSVDWILRGTDDEDSSIFVEESGINKLAPPNREAFSAFEDIQEAELISWLEESFISRRYITNRQEPGGPPHCITENKLQFAKNRISAKIKELKNPTVLKLSAPWLSNE